MKLLSRTVTFNEKELRKELDKIYAAIEDLERLSDALEQFEDDVRDVMDFMPHDEHYINLNEALDRLNKRRSRGRS